MKLLTEVSARANPRKKQSKWQREQKIQSTDFSNLCELVKQLSYFIIELRFCNFDYLLKSRCLGFQVFYTFVLGLICGQALLRFHSVFAPMFLHFLFNLMFYLALVLEII